MSHIPDKSKISQHENSAKELYDQQAEFQGQKITQEVADTLPRLGYSVEHENISKSFLEMMVLADQEVPNLEALFQVGKFLAEGNVVEIDEEKAIQYLMKAIKQNHIDALFFLVGRFEHQLSYEDFNSCALAFRNIIRDLITTYGDQSIEVKVAAQKAAEFFMNSGKSFPAESVSMTLNFFENTGVRIFWAIVQEMAEEGNSWAQYETGVSLLTPPVEQARDDQRGYDYLFKAFGNDPDLDWDIAQFLYGQMYKKDLRAIEFTHYLADEKKDAESQYDLGMYYAYGEENSKAVDPERSFHYFDLYVHNTQNAENAQNPPDLFEYAKCYLFGFGVEQNVQKGIEMLKEQYRGYYDVSNFLGKLYFTGSVEGHGNKVTVQPDLEKAYIYFSKALEIYEENDEFEDEYLNPDLAYFMGYCFYTGTNFLQRDLEGAFYYFMLGAETEHPDATFFYGKMNLEGQGTEEPNHELGREMIARAVALGSGEAIKEMLSSDRLI